jgi:hypothetical protein
MAHNEGTEMTKLIATEVNGIKVGDYVRGNHGKGNLFGVVGFVTDGITTYADCREDGNKFKFKFTLDVLVVAN